MTIATLVLSVVALVALIGTGLAVQEDSLEVVSVVVTFLVLPVLLAIVVMSIIQLA